MTLRDLIQRASIWRAGELPPAVTEATGFPSLDGALPGGGWPQSGLTEILFSTSGIGALRLVLPALSNLSQQGGWIIWVCPPHLPYPPALHEFGMDLSRMLLIELPEEQSAQGEQSLWAFEQALRFQDCAAALMWLGDASMLELRRLQLAAEAGSTWGVIFRPTSFAQHPSPAAIRLKLEPSGRNPDADELKLTLLKARGSRAGESYQLSV